MEKFRKYLPFIVIGISVVIIGIFIFRNVNKRANTTPQPAASVVPIQTQQTSNPTQPKFNLASYKCSDFDYNLGVSTSNPQFDASKYSWQTAAPRVGVDTVKVNTTAQIGLRNKFGKAADSLPFVVRVYQPDSTENVGRGVLQADQWSNQTFPKDFQSGTTSNAGIYTVVYEIYGVGVACDGFEVVQ